MNKTLIGFAILTVFSTNCWAKTFKVRPGQGDLQSVIDQAKNGDRIRLGRGTFVGNIDVSNKNIRIIGRGHRTVIQGDSGSVVTCTSGKPTIDSVVIRGGSAANGGGLNISGDCALHLRRSTITDNEASAFGAAIYLSSTGSPRFSNNIIAFNRILGSEEPHSIYIQDSTGIFNRNTVTNNVTPGNGFFVAGTSSTPVITRNLITNNGDPDHLVGRGICIARGGSAQNVTLTENVFYQNVGGAMFIQPRNFEDEEIDSAESHVDNDKFTGNLSTNPTFRKLGENIGTSNFRLKRTSAAKRYGAASGPRRLRHPALVRRNAN